MKVEDDIVSVERVMDGSTESLECGIPALVTVTHELNRPRYATTLQVLRVPRDAVSTVKIEDLGVSQLELDQHILRNQTNLKPVTASRKNILFDGSDAKSAAKQLVDKLIVDGVL